MSSYLAISQQIIEIPPGGEVILRYQAWEDYEELLRLRQDKAAIKLRFKANTKEIKLMSPLPGHGKRIDTLTDLVKMLLRHQQQDWEGFDPITLKRFPQGGIEPDACFYIQNREKILGKERFELNIDPPPDLAIEVDLTCSTKIEDYEVIASPEVWIYRRATLLIYLFDGESYQQSSNSSLFSSINVAEILPPYVERAWQIGSSVVLREFEQYLQNIPSG